MDYEKGKIEFINTWGQLGMNWGICKTMGHIHGLLLISSEPICADDIKTSLSISRGNVAMNIKSLLDWELIKKIHKPHDRKEYYLAEKELWKILQKVIIMRKKKELQPLLESLDRLSFVKPECSYSKEFCNLIKKLTSISQKADKSLENLTNVDSNWLSNTLMKLI
jgi:DNA-binding transcriptional regulator GbsR (MarR family)